VFFQIGTPECGMKEWRVRNVCSNFSFRFFWPGMINPDVEGYFPHTVCILSPDGYQMAERIRLSASRDFLYSDGPVV
jgi:hypothetical protein